VTRSIIEPSESFAYKPAGLELLKRMQSANDPSFKAICADALASVGCTNAISTIQAFASEPWKYDWQTPRQNGKRKTLR